MSDYHPSSSGGGGGGSYGARHGSSSYSSSSHHESSRYQPYSATSSSRYPPPSSSSSSYSRSREAGGSSSSSNGYHHGYSYGGPSHSSSSSSFPYRDSRGGGGSHSSFPSSSSFGDRRGSKIRKPRNEFGIAFGQPGSGLTSPDWARLSLPEFQKNFYREAPSITAIPEEEILQWRAKYKISCVGSGIPRPIRTFQEAGFPPYIMAEINRAGFEKPTPIQSQGWPMAMSGKDVVGIAETGSGKTLAFLLPSIVHINAQPLLRRGDGPIVLIIAPTRELAVQIENEAAKFANSSKIKHTCVYGGVSRRDQARQLTDGVEIVICTPGRMLDFLESRITNLKRVTYLVIDEADRLLDMGFEPQLKAIFSQVRPDRQILMWSATWPEEVRYLAKNWIQEDAIQVAVGSFETAANRSVTQHIEIISAYEKQSRLYSLLHRHLSGHDDAQLNDNVSIRKCLVFTATKRQCDFLHRSLKNDGWPCTVIHGDKQQAERDQALADFKSGRATVMMATDVASRGIHVNDITAVVNFDMPSNIEDYVHRIGRTGRCGNKGVAYSLFTKEDGKRATKLIKILKDAEQIVPPELVAIASTANSSRYGGGGGGYKSGYQKYSTSASAHGSGSGSSSHFNHRSSGGGGGGYSYPPPSSHSATATTGAPPPNTASYSYSNTNGYPPSSARAPPPITTSQPIPR